MNKNVEIGGKKDVKNIKSIDFPISYEKLKEVISYLDKKRIVSNPTDMYRDLTSQKQFKDIPYNVVRTIVAIYYQDKGKVIAKKVHSEIKQIFSQTNLNEKGGKIGSYTYTIGGL